MPNVSATVSSLDYLNTMRLLAAHQSAQPAATASVARPALVLMPMDQLILQRSTVVQTRPAPATPATPAPAAPPMPAPTRTELPARPLNLQAPGSIGKGAQGRSIERVQQQLQKWGYQLEADGDFGPKTQRVLSQFQRDQGLPANGRVDQTTLQALERNPAETPTLDALRAGHGQLAKGAQGPAVEYVQQRLKTWGYQIGKVDGDFGSQTQSAVRDFQQAHRIQVNGRVGQTTLQALEQTPVRAGRLETTSEGFKLARTAQSVAARRDTVGWCYSGVATAVSKALGVELYGGSAYQASSILARHSDFQEVKALKPSDLPKLPAGAIVVWGKTSASPNGHISVALGNGREASDHVSPQLTSLRGYTNFRVFMPVG